MLDRLENGRTRHTSPLFRYVWRKEVRYIGGGGSIRVAALSDVTCDVGSGLHSMTIVIFYPNSLTDLPTGLDLAASPQSAIASTVRPCARNGIAGRVRFLRDCWGSLLATLWSGSEGIFLPLR